MIEISSPEFMQDQGPTKRGNDMDTSLIITMSLLFASYVFNLVQYYKKKKESINDDLLKSINFILGKDITSAVSAFKNINRNYKNSYDINLSLGCIYRSQGNLDKAISIHEQLLSNKIYSRRKRCEAMVELGKDYLIDGIYD